MKTPGVRVALLLSIPLIGCGARSDVSDVGVGATTMSSAPMVETCPVTKVIARGAPIHGTNGLAFDADGHLLIASFLGNEIVVMDRESGAIVEHRALPTGAPQGIDDLVVARDGSIYYTSLVSGYVARWSPDGTVKAQFISPGANAITLSDDPTPRLFVGLDFLGDGLYEIDPNLEAPPRAIVTSKPGQYPLGFLNAFDFGPDGRLYGPLVVANGGMVVSIGVDSCSDSTSPWTDCDIRFVASIPFPMAVKFDASGSLDVVDHGGDVFRISAPTSASPGTPELVAHLTPALDNLIPDQNRLWVSNLADGSIARITDRKIEYISPGGMVLPGGVAVVDRPRGTDSLFVADVWSLREFSPASGKQIGLVDSIGAPFVPLQPTFSASADGARLLLTSIFSSTVQVWDSETLKLESHTTPTLPFDAVRFQGAIAYSTFDFAPTVMQGKVIRLDTGETILGSPYVVYPLGLAAAGDVLFVSDWYTGLVWKVDRSTATSVPSVVAAGFANPEGLALDQSGGLFVVESGNGRLSRVDLATGAKATVVDGLELGIPGIPPADAPHMTLNGVAVAPSGDVFVTGDKGDVLYRIKPQTGSACHRDE